MNEVLIPYENITTKILTKKEVQTNWAILSGLFFIFSGFMAYITISAGGSLPVIFWGSGTLFIISMAFLVGFFITSCEYKLIQLINQQTLPIITTLPNREAVDDFIKELFNKKNTYLLKLYGEMDLAMGYPILKERLEYLKSLGVYSQDEFDQHLSWLKSQFTDIHEIDIDELQKN